MAPEDADEPYSPGGSSDDDVMTTVPNLSSTTSSVDPIADELKRKMDEINRQIEAQQMEIAGMLSGDQSVVSKTNYSPSASSTTPNLGPALANISIPSNLHQILASIQPKPDPPPPPTLAPPPPVIGSLLTSSNIDDDEEYTPQPASSYKATSTAPPQPPPPPSLPPVVIQTTEEINTSGKLSLNSRLAQLTEAELLNLVPDNASLPQFVRDDLGKKQDVDMRIGVLEGPPATKKPRWDNEPPPPGLEDEFV